MVCKMLLFDYREIEKPFFESNNFENFSIKFFQEPLNIETVKMLSQEDFSQTSVISLFITSHITTEVLNKFENLRIISTRSARYGHIDLTACINKNIAIVNVEAYENKSIDYVLKESFKGITSVLCGEKSYRVI